MTFGPPGLHAWAAAHDLAVGAALYRADGGRTAASAAGRAAACEALTRIGAPALDAARHADGRPMWPTGTIGSISHAHGTAVAIVGRRGAGPTAAAVGVDVDARGGLPLTDARLVLDDREYHWAEAGAWPDEAATALWSAKEAAFKAWSEATAGALPSVDPQRHVHVDIGRGDTVSVAAQRELAGAVRGPATGGLWYDDDLVFVAVVYTPTRSSNPFR